mmetsp:Transcript_2823/g.6506  ORF Transcript_2823/g.6506 Transcript_2823/m.6506 type:complete len:210 (-) Transcript_2823:1128-1757(-)
MFGLAPAVGEARASAFASSYAFMALSVALFAEGREGELGTAGTASATCSPVAAAPAPEGAVRATSASAAGGAISSPAVWGCAAVWAPSWEPAAAEFAKVFCRSSSAAAASSATVPPSSTFTRSNSATAISVSRDFAAFLAASSSCCFLSCSASASSFVVTTACAAFGFRPAMELAYDARALAFRDSNASGVKLPVLSSPRVCTSFRNAL